jgi:copper(I)-binding protein
MSARRLDPARAASLLVVIALALAACTSTASSVAPSAGSIVVEDAWARTSMGMDRAGAAYLEVVNETGQADALVGATSSAAGTVELHETSADAGGQMAMHPVERIELPAGGRVALEPGGLHVMLIGLTADLVAGEEIELTLDFEHAPDLKVKAAVRAE